MSSVMVERATSNMLIGPDWAMNLEICDIVNRDPGQAKDVVKALKKRIIHKTPKVQLLALTVNMIRKTFLLLETMIKNCGDIVHMHVAERDILHEMVKIVKKRNDYHVKEKILTLIDTWQEVFGSARARYPQYFAAYQELLRSGAVFPQRSNGSVPIITPPQTQPLQNYPPSLRISQQEEPELSIPDFPALSLTEIQNARGIKDILSEMLDALDPGNREGLRQDVIVDLVDQCRSYKQRVVQLANSTTNEELLSQGLSLNDDMQRVLAKHDAIAAGIAIRVEKPKSLQTQIESSAARKPDTSKEPVQRSSASTSATNQSPFEILALPAPPSSSSSKAPVAPTPKIDLLSGDDYIKPEPANSLALVPVTEYSASDQNVLAFADMFEQNTANKSNHNLVNSFNSSTSNSTSSQTYPPVRPALPQHPAAYPDGATSNAIVPYGQQPQLNSTGSWNGQPAYGMYHQNQALYYGRDNRNGDIPPAPLEVKRSTNPFDDDIPVGTTLQPVHPASVPPQPVQVTQQSNGFMSAQPMTRGQTGGMQVQPVASMQLVPPQPQPSQSNTQYGLMYPSMQMNQGMGMYSQPAFGGGFYGMNQQQLYGVQMSGYGYGQPSGGYYIPNTAYAYASANELSQRMNGLSAQNGGSNGTTANKQNKPEDSLFGDLLSIAKMKQSKPAAGKVGG